MTETRTYLDKNQLYRSSEFIQLVALYFSKLISLVNPSLFVSIVFDIIILDFLLTLHNQVLKVHSICQILQRFLGITQGTISLAFRHVKLTDYALRDEIEYVREAARSMSGTWKVFEKLGKCVDHRVVARRVVACYTQDLNEAHR